MKPSPPGWPRISPALFYDDAPAAIDWLCRVFGFEVRLKVEGEPGIIEHSELEIPDGLIMVSTAERKKSAAHGQMVSPKSIGGRGTQSLCVHLDDVDAHHARVKAAGAKLYRPLETTDYGEEYFTDRGYGVYDLEGHQWYFVQRLRTPAARAR
jgi:uncharacterized glyoxalase superfamily protein PhnB